MSEMIETPAPAATDRPWFAPRINKQNAREMQRKSRESIARKKAAQQAALEAALAPADATADELRKARAARQVDRFLLDMEQAKSVQFRMALASTITKLWPLVQATVGPVKPRQGKSRPDAPVTT
jgi:hypothetical protein